MGRRNILWQPLLLALALSAAASGARAAGPAVGLRAGSAGIGPEATFALGEAAHLRLGVFGLGYGRSFTETGIDYDADLTLRNGLLLLDWHPGAGLFRLTAGAAVNDNRLTVTGPIEELLRRELPDLPPVGFDLGVLRGTATVDTVGPYLGIGLGNPFRRRRWSVSLDLGAVYHGAPSVRLVADTALPIDLIPGGREELERMLAEEEQALAQELDRYQVLPVVTLGLSYAF